ncbi:Sal-like protein 1 [Sparganum proliferum]
MKTPKQPTVPFFETPNATRGELLDLFKTESPLQHLPPALTQRINFPSLLLPSSAQANGYCESTLLGQKIEGTLRRLIFDKAPFPAHRLPSMSGGLSSFGQFVPRTENSAFPRREEEERYTAEDEGPEDLSSSRIWEKDEDIQEESNEDSNRQAIKISLSSQNINGRRHGVLSTSHRKQPNNRNAATFRRSIVTSSPHRPRSADAASIPGLRSVTEDVLDSLTRLGHLFECEACGLFFRERALWKAHDSLHGPGSEHDNFVCSLCGQCLSDACAFALHFAGGHHQLSPGVGRNRSSRENSSEEHTVAGRTQTPTKPTTSSSSSSSSSASVSPSSVSMAFHLYSRQESRVPTTVSLGNGLESHPIQSHLDTHAPDQDKDRTGRSGYWHSYNSDDLELPTSPVRNEIQMDTE